MHKWLYSIFLTGTLLGSGVWSYGQNLVLNPDFESYATCPSSFQGICEMLAPPWECPTNGTSDYFNSCAISSSPVDVPVNAMGTQATQSGNGYAGIVLRHESNQYREYLITQLTEPLAADMWYYVSFYVSPAETGCNVEHVGAYFSNTDIFVPNTLPLLFEPQIEHLGGYMNDYDSWLLVAGCFQAVGGEQYLVIGNFETDADSPMNSGCFDSYAYYFVDDVSVIPGPPPDEFTFDLGGPVDACFSYVIDPMEDGPSFQWSDGSSGPTLEVTESGTYAVTISNGCTSASDSIEVTVTGNYTPVDLGPPVVEICIGDSYTISLDPDLAEYTWHDGSHDTEYTITSSGTYSVTLDDGCLLTSDEITVEVLNEPVPFDLGDDFYLCVDDEFQFSLDPQLGDFTWQDNSTSPTFIVTEAGTYAVTISNICGMESDEINIYDLQAPIVDIGPDEYVLCSGSILEIEEDPQMGSITWQDGSAQPNIEISQPGLYAVTITNICGTDNDQMLVTVLSPPTADLGPDIQMCEGDTLQLSAQNIPGTYLSGTYSLTVSNDCGVVTDTIEVDYHSLVIPPDFGPDVSLCPGESIVLYADNPTASYLWQDQSTADSLFVTTSGTYSVQVSSFCGTASDTINVNVNADPPQVNLPAQLSLCHGETITLDAAIVGVNYLWNDNSQNQQIIITTSGTYSVTVSNACGTDVDTTIILDGGPAPMVELGNDFEICFGETVLLTPVFSNVDNWLWHDNSTLPTYTVSGAGTITVEVSNACSTDYDTLVVSLLQPVPSLDLGPDTAICSGEPLLLFINTPGVNILWPDGSSSSQFSVPGPGLFYATIFNECGQSYDTILVNALPEIPALDLGTDQSLCPGELITLSPGIADVNYLWQDGSTNSSYQTNTEESIILTITNECGSNTDTLEIVESTQGPQVNLGVDIQECEGATVTIPSGISGVDYVWQDGSVDPQYVTTQSGVFILQVSNNCGTDSDTLVVDISGVPPSPVLGPDTTLCEGIFLVLSSAADAETSVEWQDGSSALSYTVSAAGVFILSESNRCGDASDTIAISYLDAPASFTLGPDTTLCPGESIILTAPSTSFEIQWQDGNNQLEIMAGQAGVYSLQLSNECGSVTDAIMINIDTHIPQLSLDPTISWCEGDVITLDATQPFPSVYLWSTGETSSSIQLTTPGQYSVDVIARCGMTSQQVEVIPMADCIPPKGIYIPNVFSPNGDGINDLFEVHTGTALQVSSMEGSIYDRWGNVVFSGDTSPFTWDGSFSGETVMPGVFVYTIKIKYLNQGIEREEVFTGDVTVVR
jgi:gliding motility-associated-like protein